MKIRNKFFTIKFCWHRWAKFAPHQSRPNKDKYWCFKCDEERTTPKSEDE